MTHHHFSYDDLITCPPVNINFDGPAIFPAEEITVLSSNNVVVPDAEHIEVFPSVVAVLIESFEVRKSTRGSKPPIWHKDYVIKTGSSSCTYSIGDNIDYTALTSTGFQQSAGDYSLFTKKEGDKISIILVCVDDLKLTGNDWFMLQHTKDVLHTTFKIKDLGDLTYNLGIEFARSEARILMPQRKYALDLVADMGLAGAKPITTLMDQSQKLTSTEFDHMGIHLFPGLVVQQKLSIGLWPLPLQKWYG
uniref:Reverse transcriptase Ty1/copia-type domain-containing protein n=1 Tax=Solanum lycopersicum TaxID=4081 RepID=A0A3Q7FLW5_SOLLC